MARARACVCVFKGIFRYFLQTLVVPFRESLLFKNRESRARVCFSTKVLSFTLSFGHFSTVVCIEFHGHAMAVFKSTSHTGLSRKEERWEIEKLTVAYGSSTRGNSFPPVQNRPVARTKKRSTMDFPSALPIPLHPPAREARMRVSISRFRRANGEYKRISRASGHKRSIVLFLSIVTAFFLLRFIHGAAASGD